MIYICLFLKANAEVFLSVVIEIFLYTFLWSHWRFVWTWWNFLNWKKFYTKAKILHHTLKVNFNPYLILVIKSYVNMKLLVYIISYPKPLITKKSSLIKNFFILFVFNTEWFEWKKFMMHINIKTTHISIKLSWGSSS